MQPMGRKPKKANHEDNHPPKGWKNWWEDIEDEDNNKRKERMQSKRDIITEINEMDK